ncbi:SpoIVB peptidase S55 domain-containing protein [Sporomusa sp.]|uniref:SpoIVB peptidase S55 domain-containing protein n=1 Tax=Sporomusa sp. TaxID=2078658 RepID=UPI002BDADE09|nr:SpoIVB peptidase S55 domain-containing protein [Sporomusa sp.]HWR44350.1 SpoIVB peptidase S55 domain-containing protein [Sporomusa sp.]
MNILFNILKRCLAALAAVFVMLPIAYVQAAPEFMPVDQIVKGMHGTAKTVVAGSQIEEFGVEVLGVMKQKGPSGDLILVRTYGDVIERTGGIAQGMSGSPVYINGKLVGAIAYGWSLTDHKIGMVTPIADMLKLWELNGGQAELQAPTAEAPGNAVSTPLMASGFGEQALKMLADKLKPYNLTPYAVSGSMSDANNGIAYKTVEPGSTVGVQLVRGDISLGALGTVTYVEGDKLLAFGHPFLKKGKVNYFLTDAEVYTTLNGMENSFKVGTSTETIGMITQDRGAGIAGTFGKFPNIVPLRISVTDKTLGRTNDLWAQVVQDEELAPVLSAVSVFNAIEKTTDRVGSGTARISFEISAAGIPGEVLKRENMFYTQGNVGELAVAEVHEALALLTGNQFNAVNIMDVKVNVTVDSERRTATIIEAKANTAVAKPGDKVDIAVKIKPFRNDPVTRHITYTVPKEQQPGTLMLSVRGGGMVSVAQLVGKRQNGEEDFSKLFMTKAKPKSLEEAVKELVNRDRNNDIVVEAIEMNMPDVASAGAGKNAKPVADTFETSPSPALPDSSGKKPAKTGRTGSEVAKTAKGDDSKQKVYITTDYIIDGDTQVMVNITK